MRNSKFTLLQMKIICENANVKMFISTCLLDVSKTSRIICLLKYSICEHDSIFLMNMFIIILRINV